METHKRKSAEFLALGFAATVLVISASTSFAFFVTYFPTLIPASVLDVSIGSLISGVVGVALFDMACVVWLILFLNHAETPEQRAITLAMVVATFAGSAMASVAYLGLTATGQMALDPATQDTIGTFALIVVIVGVVANFGAIQAYNRFSLANKERVREADRRDSVQSAEDDQEHELTVLVQKKVKEKIEERADWLSDMEAEYIVAKYVRRKEDRYSTQAPAPAPRHQANGTMPIPAASQPAQPEARPTNDSPFRLQNSRSSEPHMGSSDFPLR